MRMVPEGVIAQDCVADGPPDAFAVTVKAVWPCGIVAPWVSTRGYFR